MFERKTLKICEPVLLNREKFNHISIYLSINLFIYQSIYLSIYLSINLFIYQFIYIYILLLSFARTRSNTTRWTTQEDYLYIYYLYLNFLYEEKKIWLFFLGK